jgi:transposase
MKRRRIYSKEFKEEAIRLVEEDGISCQQAESNLGIGVSALSRWMREKDKLKEDAFCGSGNVKPSEKDFKDLHKELERVKRERDILKKAVAIFSKEPNRYSGS